MQEKDYIQFITEIKGNILKSRYKAASLANKEMLLLYYHTGHKLSQKIEEANWGAGVIQKISKDLQKELPGLRGFSHSNLHNMRQFYKEYANLKQFLEETTFNQPLKFIQSVTGELENNEIGQLPTAQLELPEILQLLTGQISQSTTGQMTQEKFIISFIEKTFLKIGFTHHILLISKCKKISERLFYFNKIVENQWSITLLEHHIHSQLYQQKGKLTNNFHKVLPKKLLKHATDAFKGEYLLDFINIDDNDDERVLENEIVKNIKKFIMSLGNDFTFIGNQYRVVVEDEEFFIDLLFFHRTLQSLVAFELKRGKFKAEYAGKMNLYLSALDEYVKKGHENPSIGIILCKEKTDKIVKFAFRDYNKAMGVSTFKTSRQIPEKYKGLLPDTNELKKLL